MPFVPNNTGEAAQSGMVFDPSAGGWVPADNGMTWTGPGNPSQNANLRKAPTPQQLIAKVITLQCRPNACHSSHTVTRVFADPTPVTHRTLLTHVFAVRASQAHASQKLMAAMQDLSTHGQDAVAKYYEHADLEVRDFVRDLCEAGFSPA